MSGGQKLVSNGFGYDDPYGNLLIWVTIGGRRESSSWPSISVVNLTLVVTTYQKDCLKPGPGFQRCASGRRCIWKHYFCDRHFNCPMDIIPADEDGCTYKPEGSEHTTSTPGAGDVNYDGSLNAVSLTLIIVCSALVLLLILILLVRYRRIRKCCASVSASANSSCELPEQHQHQPRSLVELNRQRHLRETESNIYLPLTTFLDQPMHQGGQQPQPQPHQYPQGHQQTTEVSRGRGLPPPEEPPPAYDDLFPENHVQVAAHAPEVQVQVLDRRSTRRNVDPGPDVVQVVENAEAERDRLVAVQETHEAHANNGDTTNTGETTNAATVPETSQPRLDSVDAGDNGTEEVIST